MRLIVNYILDQVDDQAVLDLVSSLDFEGRATQVYYDPGGSAAIRRMRYGPDVFDRLSGQEFASLEVTDHVGETLLSTMFLRRFLLRELSFDEAYDDLSARIEALTAHPAFTVAVYGDRDDCSWQGETSVSNYRMFKRPYEHLPRTVDRRGREVIDVSGNSGRLRETLGMRLWAGAQVWFGPAADAIVGLDRVRSLPVGEVSELSGGRVHVRLFEVGDPMGEVREKQRIFEEWLRFDELEARREELLAAYNAGELY